VVLIASQAAYELWDDATLHVLATRMVDTGRASDVRMLTIGLAGLAHHAVLTGQLVAADEHWAHTATSAGPPPKTARLTGTSGYVWVHGSTSAASRSSAAGHPLDNESPAGRRERPGQRRVDHLQRGGRRHVDVAQRRTGPAGVAEVQPDAGRHRPVAGPGEGEPAVGAAQPDGDDGTHGSVAHCRLLRDLDWVGRHAPTGSFPGIAEVAPGHRRLLRLVLQDVGGESVPCGAYRLVQ